MVGGDAAKGVAGGEPRTERVWYEPGLRFGCQRCGACCTGEPGVVWVAPGEIAPLAAALGLDGESFVRRYLRREGARLRLYEWPGGDCVLFDRARGCRAYRARPAQCRAWPFWKRHLGSPGAWQHIASACPGCGRGPLRPAPWIEDQAGRWR